jgi:hypothetical protein
MNPLEELVLTAQTNNETILNQWKNTHGIEAHPDGLWWKNKALVIVGNDDLKRGVLHHFHNHIAAGHPRITKTLINIRRHYWWPGMKDFIMQYIKGCATCQMMKINTHLTSHHTRFRHRSPCLTGIQQYPHSHQPRLQQSIDLHSL